MASMDQELLAEQLQILNHLHTNLDIPYDQDNGITNKDDHDKGFKAEICALNTVAILLTTGEPNDVTAVTLDKCGKLELVIAKNRCPSYTDDAAVRNLISLLTNPATINDPEDIFPSIMIYCLKNINKRQQQLHESLSQFLPTLEQVLQQYPPGLLPTNSELPGFTAYISITHSDPTMDIKDLILDIFQFCLKHSQHPLDSHDKDRSYMAYSALCLGVDVLSHSQFLNKLTHDPRHPKWQQEAQKLKQRLLKVCQYYFDIRPLALGVNRWFQDREISYRWVNLSVIPDHRPFEISPSFKEALLHAPVTDPAQTIQKIQKKHPQMFQQPWPSSIHTCIHAEIQIIIDLNPPTSTLPLTRSTPFNFTGPQAIGCSKRTCFCCTAWIKSFNHQFGTKWTTSGSNNKPYANWALPAVAYDPYGEGKSCIDRNVLREVKFELVDVLGYCVFDEDRESVESMKKKTYEKIDTILGSTSYDLAT